jgi:CBS-domain-containing membrane protein
MRREFPVTRSEESVTTAQGQLNVGRVRALPVVRADGMLAGLLTAADVGEALRLLAARPQLTLASATGQPHTTGQGPFQVPIAGEVKG